MSNNYLSHVERMKTVTNYLSHVERMKAVTDLATETKFPLSRVLDMYNKFNNQFHKEHGDLSTYNFYLSEKAFELTKNFLTLLN